MLGLSAHSTGSLSNREGGGEETFDDGDARFRAVCEHGLEGVVAKKRTSRCGPNRRGWIKTKNPNYWRLDLAREAMQKLRERRVRQHI
jgi:ATP-dependent DNA ligase